MEKEKDVLPLLATETMIVKHISFKEEPDAWAESIPTARVELQFWGKSRYEYFYPNQLVFTLKGQRARDAVKLYKKGDVIHCRCELIVATKH